MSSWFGFGGSGEKEDKERPMKIDEFDSHSAFDNSHSTTNFAPSAGGSSMGGGSFEQELAMEQQKAIIQAVMFKLTEASFDACVTKPSSSLSRGEQSCISSVVGKYLDTSELVASRLQGGQH